MKQVVEESLDVDWQVRAAAFATLANLVRLHGEVLPWSVIETGFMYEGKTLLFANQSKGIFRPFGMRDAALSVKTTVPRRGVPKYEDIETDDAFVYAFQSRGPDYHDNRILLRAVELRAPLIYFYGVEPGHYRPLWPVYATSALAEDHVLLAVEPSDQILEPGAHLSDPLMQKVVRRYATVQAKRRLHQDMFSSAVLRAYQQRCAICRLPRRELLEAAHILPDRHPRGEPVVPNGLALCKLHHSAYDSNLMGIRPDGIVEISHKLMLEHDGPTLEHAIKGFDGRSIHLPTRSGERPNPEYLDERYSLFRKAV